MALSYEQLMSAAEKKERSMAERTAVRTSAVDIEKKKQRLFQAAEKKEAELRSAASTPKQAKPWPVMQQAPALSTTRQTQPKSSVNPTAALASGISTAAGRELLRGPMAPEQQLMLSAHNRAEAAKTTGEWEQRCAQYLQLMQAPDFEENSKYRPTRKSDEEIETGKGPLSFMVPQTALLEYGDIKYDAINRDPEAMEKINIGKGKQYTDLTDEQLALFNYIYYDRSPEEAYQFLDDMDVAEKFSSGEAWALNLANAAGSFSTSAIAEKALNALSGKADAPSAFYGDLQRDLARAREQHSAAATVGSVSGTLGLISSIAMGVGAIPGFTSMPAIAQSLISGAASMGGTTAIQNAGHAVTGMEDLGDYGLDVLTSTGAGAASGLAAGSIGSIGKSVLQKLGLTQNMLARTVTAGFAGAGGAAARSGVRQGSDVLRGRNEFDSGELLEEALVGFAFSAIGFLTRNFTASPQSAAAQDEGEALANKYFKGMNQEEAKAEYRRLAREYADVFAHTGSTADMTPEQLSRYNIVQELNTAWGWLNKQSGAQFYQNMQTAKKSGDTAGYQAAKSGFDGSVTEIAALAATGAFPGQEAQDAVAILEAVSKGGMIIPAESGVTAPVASTDTPLGVAADTQATLQRVAEEMYGVDQEQETAPDTETAIKVGRATILKSPYSGEVPVQGVKKEKSTPYVSDELVSRAQSMIKSAEEGSKLGYGAFKNLLTRGYEAIFKSSKHVEVDGLTFQGAPYYVDINNGVPAKVISDVNHSPEKLALLEILPEVVKNGEFVGSTNGKKKVVRYDHFETAVIIHGKPYLALFETEVYPGANNYKTHRLISMELAPQTDGVTGTPPAPSVEVPTPYTKRIPQVADGVNMEYAQLGGGDIPASESTLRRTEAVMALDRKRVEQFSGTLGKAGRSALIRMHDPSTSAETYLPAMTAYYNAGRSGGDMAQVYERVGDAVTAPQAQAAYLAGQADGAAVDTGAPEPYNKKKEQTKIKEAESHGGEKAIHLRDGSQRSDGAYPGGSVRQLEGGTGQDQGRNIKGRPADAGAAALTHGEKVTTASLGIGGGSDSDGIYIVTGGETASTAAAKKLAKQRGLRLILFMGDDLTITRDGKKVSVRAYISGDRVFIRADHPEYTAEQFMRHEAGHDMIAKGEIDPDTVRERINNALGAEKVDQLAALYEAAYRGTALTPAEVWEETICDSLGDMNIFSGTVHEGPAQELLDHARKAVSAELEVSRNKGPPEGQQKYSIEIAPDGKRYVRADRQVIFGSDPDSWSEQLEDYINGKIRRGEDVHLIGADGDELILTADTAGKISSPYRGDGTRLSDAEYERKVNAGAHIDELVQVSKSQGKKKADVGGRHGDFASQGWDYRDAYFQDFDGKYYQVTLSVAINDDGKTVYNIGKIRRRDFPNHTGSSAKGGAQGVREVSSKDSVPQGTGEVNGKFSQGLESIESMGGMTAEKARPTSEELSLKKDRKDSKIETDKVAAGERRGKKKRPKLSKQEWRQVQSAQMQKYAGVDEDSIPETGYVFAHDKFYLIQNYGLGAFEVTVRLDPEMQQKDIDRFLEEFK